MDASDGTRNVLGVCEWCGRQAYSTIVLRPSRKTSKGLKAQRRALVCPTHFANFSSQDEIGITTQNRGAW